VGCGKEVFARNVCKGHDQTKKYLGCDFFERRGEKRINVGTLLMLLFFYHSDGVLCFLTFFIVILLQFFAAHVRMYAYTHIRIAK
jgi:hypothetical protein